MKVKISNYPSRLSSRLFTEYMQDKYGYVDWPKERTRFERGLEWWDDRLQDFYNIFNWLYFDRRQQKVSIRIDPWDTWSMDHTLSEIITPMLIQLKETKHGAPIVDDEDVPEELKSTSAPPKENEWDTDDNHFERWDWVLDEMIFAFDAKRQNDWQDQFYSGQVDLTWKPIGDGEVSEMVKGPNDTFKVDEVGLKAYHCRIQNGFRLFGKYYENLWD